MRDTKSLTAQPHAGALARGPACQWPARPLRVVMLVEHVYDLGGAQEQALRLCHALESHGVETRIVTGRWRRAHPRAGRIQGVPVSALFTCLKMFHLRGLSRFAIPIYLSSLILHLYRKRREYDVIHVHSATCSAFGASVAGKRLGKPVVMKVMASGPWSDFKRMRERKQLPGGDWMVRRLKRVDRVVCLNDEIVEECIREGFSPGQIVSIPNGYPVSRVPPLERDGTLKGGEVIFVGRLDPQKNPVLLLDAMALAAQRPGGDGMQLHMIGDGPQRAELEERAQRLGIADRVRFLGRLDDVAQQLRVSSIFVLPSLSEGMSNALLEAMAHGLPCVATAIPGNKDLVKDGETGILVQPSDPQELALALLALANDRELRERLGAAGRAYVEKHFDMDRVAERYVDVYRSLVTQGGSTPG